MTDQNYSITSFNGTMDARLMLGNFITRELSNSEIDDLKEVILKRIQQEEAFELLPYYGFLFFKDAIWIGKVFEITSKMSADCSGELNTAMTVCRPRYILDIHHKEVKEIIVDTGTEALPRRFAIFDLEAGDDRRRSLEVNTSLMPCLQHFLQDTCSKPLKTEPCGKQNARVVAVRELTNDDECRYLPGVSRNTEARAFFAALLNTSSPTFSSVSGNVDGYEIRQMTIKETLYAVKHWKFNSKAMQICFAVSASQGLSMGAFAHGFDTPVSWAFVSLEGAISGLQTLSEHRRKGLGKAVVKNISMILIQKGLFPFVFIEDIESASVPVAFFTSLGFHVLQNYHFNWIQVEI